MYSARILTNKSFLPVTATMRTANLAPPQFRFLSFFFPILWKKKRRELAQSSTTNANLCDISIPGLSDGSNILNLVVLYS